LVPDQNIFLIGKNIMTSQILTPQPTEYTLPESQRLALLPPPKNGEKIRRVSKGQGLISKKRKLKNNV